MIRSTIIALCLVASAFLSGCDHPGRYEPLTATNVDRQDSLAISNSGRQDPLIISDPVEKVQGSENADMEEGSRLFDQRKFAEAIPYLERALEKATEARTRSDVLTSLGNCYNELNRFKESLEYYDRALREDPTNHKAYVGQGVVYRLSGDYDKAAQSYSKALELAPDYAELHASMGVLAMTQGQYDAAVRHLERAVQLNDSLAVAHSNLALAYASVGRFDEAQDELKKAVIRGYHQPEVLKERIERLRETFGQDQ